MGDVTFVKNRQFIWVRQRASTDGGGGGGEELLGLCPNDVVQSILRRDKPRGVPRRPDPVQTASSMNGDLPSGWSRGV